MRIEIFIFNRIKDLCLKIPGIRDLFYKFEYFFFEIFKIVKKRFSIVYNKKNRDPPLTKLIIKFKKIYENYYYDSSTSQIIKYLENEKSAWKGHHYFAQWIVRELNPKTIVDLGIDRGFSTFMFAAQKIGKIYGIDWFMKKNPLGKKIEVYFPIMRLKKKMEKKFGINNVVIIKGTFSEVAKKWKKPIDILHIDGNHSYESVKEDYYTWNKFLKENGIVLLHDTNIYPGVVKFFKELDLPKYNFTHSFGLGIISRNKEIISKIKERWKI